jgi:hypothetical protein
VAGGKTELYSEGLHGLYWLVSGGGLWTESGTEWTRDTIWFVLFVIEWWSVVA